MSTVSRQRLWQIKVQAKGLCTKCAAPACGGTCLCNSCRLKNRETARAYYRRRHGIPVDAPLLRSGRPRITHASSQPQP